MDVQLIFTNRALMRKRLGYLRFINDEHPEAQKGEVFLCNANQMLWDDIELVTKRKGKVAYYNRGGMMEDKTYFPVFVKRAELRRLNIRPKLPR